MALPPPEKGLTDSHAPRCCTPLLHLAALAASTLSLLGQTVTTSDGFVATIAGGAATITDYVGPGGAITIPSSAGSVRVTTIANRAITSRSRARITAVTIPAGITTIAAEAFYAGETHTAFFVAADNPAYATDGVALFNKGRTTLHQLCQGYVGAYNVPESVISIGSRGFSDCHLLTAVFISKNVAAITEGGGAFGGDTNNLRSINVDGSNPAFSSVDGVLFNKAQTTLVRFPDAWGPSYSVPYGVTEIGNWAFVVNGTITTVGLPPSLKRIGDNAFQYCINLKQISLPSGLVSIGGYAFFGVHSLADVTLPATVATIEGLAFGGNNLSLAAIKVDANNPYFTAHDGVLFTKDKSTLVSYPSGKGSAYVVPSFVTSIGSMAFAYGKIEALAIPPSVRSIAANVFTFCDDLTAVVFLGDAPPVPFDGSVRKRATVYYTANAKGWTSTWGGGPTALYTPPTLQNLSLRTSLGAGQTLIVGAVVDGGNKQLLFRAVGPSLNQFSLQGMPDPALSLFDANGTEIAQNNDWATTLAPVFASVGAFPLALGSKDSALVQQVIGALTVQVRGAAGGTLLVEAYDINRAATPKLVNLSARNLVGTGADVLIVGLNVGGVGPKQLLVRAVGPTLATFRVGNPLQNPKVDVYDSTGRLLGTNDDWDPALAPTFNQVGAFALPAGSRDAALVLTISAGTSYTVHVSGVGSTTGEALVEVYEIDMP